MKTCLIITFFLLFAACIHQKEENKEVFPVPNAKDINNILFTIIQSDCTSVKRSADAQKAFINMKLSKPLLIRPGQIRILNGAILKCDWDFYLMDFIHQTKNYFSPADTSFIIHQIEKYETCFIDTNGVKRNYLFVGDVEKSKNQFNGSVILFSLPLFSKDLAHAYVIIVNHCGSLCGYRIDVILRKYKNKWNIVRVIEKWES